jgi:hypothetical protein
MMWLLKLPLRCDLLTFDLLVILKVTSHLSQNVVQSAKTTPNEAEITSSNHPPPSCMDISKKKVTSHLG